MTPTYIIYCLTNTVNGKRYIGQTLLGLERRVREHMYAARGNGTWFGAIHKAIKKYGMESFAIEILADDVQQDEVDLMEVLFISMFRSCEIKHGYNLSPGGRGRHSVSPETREKMRQSRLGKKTSDATKAKLSITSKNRKVSQKTRDAISRANTGRHVSEATRAKLSAAHTGKVLTAEHVQKVRDKALGRKHTEEAKEKMRMAAKRSWTVDRDDRLAALMLAHLGVKRTGKALENIQNAHKKVEIA